MLHVIQNNSNVKYFIGFKDRSAIGDVVKKENIKNNDPSFLAHVIILDGQVIGGWKRILEKKTVSVELNLITKLLSSE